jgi:perosamine synthetase
MDFIPVNEPRLDGNEERYLVECVRTGWISSEGPFVARLEKGMADRMGRKHAIAVCNGSAALDAAVAALKLQPGDEVILPAHTIISCASAIVRAGAVPVLADCDPLTWNVTVENVAACITERTRAIMAVHIFGLPAPMNGILALAEKHGLFVIEDAAEAIGQTCQGPVCRNRPCGGLGTISCLSFYPNKHVTTGEGGMILTDDDELAERCRGLRNLCFQKPRFVHEKLGWNFRMSNLQAAVGVAQLERLDKSLDRKRQIGALYQRLLAETEGLQLPLERTPEAENIYWVFAVVLDDSVPFNAAEAMARLAQAGVGTRPFFWPMHEQPVLRRMGLFEHDHHPVAERIARRGFYLPSGLGTTDAQLEASAEALKQMLETA